ncbi:MAG: hypothetical protein JKY37_01345 [Nannocystaceae bacterium]|nr:hypothetical protein [Nannocystaceae bacterium]
MVTRNLGSLYDEVGDRDAAVAAYTRAIKILERSSSTSANLASYRGDLRRVLRTQGRLDASLAATTAATEQLSAMDPAPVLIEVPVLVAHAQTLLAMDRRNEARAAATRAVDMLRGDRPKHAGEALSVLAKIEYADGSPDVVVAPLVERAAEAFERAAPNIQPQAKEIRAWWTSVSQAAR